MIAFFRDYTSEKLFDMAKFNIIPVVLNGVDMKEIAPPHSYINVLDYKSTPDLVEELNRISSNDTLYASYFWWKEYYEIHNEVRDI